MLGKNFINSNWRGRFFRYAPLILWIGVIFFMSSGQASMSETSRFIRPFLEWLFPQSAPETLTIYHGYIRKFAHFFEYAVLAFWSWLAFRYSSIVVLRKYWFVWSFIFIALTASMDEYNQSLNAARTGSIYDVLLDISGGLFSIIILLIFTKTDKRQVIE